MDHLPCHKETKKKKKADLIKDEGEGDWGTGVADDQPRQDDQTRQITTDWPREFHPLDPRIRPSESDKDEVTQPNSTEDQPRPGPSSRPTSVRDLPSNMSQRQSEPLLTRGEKDKPVNKRQSTPLLTEGERDRLTPLITTNIQRSSFLTQGYKTQSKGQHKSVSGQEPEEQHIRRNKTLEPNPVREQAVGPSGHTYRPLERLQDRHKQGLHLRPREQDSEGDKPPSKILQVSPMDEVPAWMPTWRRERNERQGERGRERGPSPCNGNRGGARPDMESDLDPNPEQGQNPEDLPPTPMEEEK